MNFVNYRDNGCLKCIFTKNMIMITSRNISLKPYNSFGIDVTADSMIRLKSEDEAVDLFDKREKLTGPVLILGGGSNILFAGDYKGTIIAGKKDITSSSQY